MTSSLRRDISHTEIAILENLIDKRGLEDVLCTIAAIGDAKVERLAETEQNATVAKKWADLVEAIEMIVRDARGL